MSDACDFPGLSPGAISNITIQETLGKAEASDGNGEAEAYHSGQLHATMPGSFRLVCPGLTDSHLHGTWQALLLLSSV